MADAEPVHKRAKSTDDHEGSDTEEDELALDAKPNERDDEDDEDDTVHVDFGLFDPQEVDFLSLKRLVKDLLPGNEARFAAGSSSLASSIIAQPDVGTMVKVGEDVDVWAFVTLLDWEAHKDSEFVKEMQRFLLAKSPAATAADKTTGPKQELLPYLDGSKGRLSLLLSERMINFPPELAPSMYASLIQDRQWAQDQRDAAGDAEAAAQLRPDWLLCMAPCAKETIGSDSSVYYMHFEEELLQQSAVLSFDIPVPASTVTSTMPAAAEASASSDETAPSSSAAAGTDSADGPSSAQRLRRVFVVRASILDTALDGMTALVASAQEIEAKAHTAAGKADGRGGTSGPAKSARRR